MRSGRCAVFMDVVDQVRRRVSGGASRREYFTEPRIYNWARRRGRSSRAAVLGKNDFVLIEENPEAADVVSVFERTEDRIEGIVNSFYLLKYCSTKRSGVHTLRRCRDARGRLRNSGDEV